MEQIFIYMIMPKEIVDLRKTGKCEFLEFWAQPYKESIELEAEYHKVKIGEIQREDFGLYSKEFVAKLNRRFGHGKENDIESYVIKFSADVLGASLAGAV